MLTVNWRRAFTWLHSAGQSGCSWVFTDRVRSRSALPIGPLSPAHITCGDWRVLFLIRTQLLTQWLRVPSVLSAVVRITQALRQQQQPGRLHSTRGGNNTLTASNECTSPTSSEPVSLRRGGLWENGSSSNTLTLNTTTMSAASSAAPVSASSASPSSPLSTFFSLSSSPLTTLASFLPSAAAGAATATGSNGPPNMGEIESLLLRSMPMFGNLVDRD
ncbi:hypothetical protein B0O80DRAFT_484804 [Mortierella sp. GBAus27b]|nr:hypothetical protein B0O80DRAFT_484804 [Mortierella sp. GBAus27b]